MLMKMKTLKKLKKKLMKVKQKLMEEEEEKKKTTIFVLVYLDMQITALNTSSCTEIVDANLRAEDVYILNLPRSNEEKPLKPWIIAPQYS
jgi:hypothetical protein